MVDDGIYKALHVLLFCADLFDLLKCLNHEAAN